MDLLHSAENVLNVLYVWVEFQRTELGLTEISRLTGINKSTVYKILRSLLARNLVFRDPQTKKYRLEARVLELGSFFLRNLSIKDIAHPILKNLAAVTGKTVTFALRKETHLVFIDRIDGSENVRFYCDIGKIIPYNSGAAAKAVFSFLPRKQIEEITKTKARKFTENTKTWTQLLQEASIIQERGYSISDEEVDRGVIAVGAPVFDHTGAVVAGLALAGLKYTLPQAEQQQMIELTIKHSSSISLKLGAPPQR